MTGVQTCALPILILLVGTVILAFATSSVLIYAVVSVSTITFCTPFDETVIFAFGSTTILLLPFTSAVPAAIVRFVNKYPSPATKFAVIKFPPSMFPAVTLPAILAWPLKLALPVKILLIFAAPVTDKLLENTALPITVSLFPTLKLLPIVALPPEPYCEEINKLFP